MPDHQLPDPAEPVQAALNLQGTPEEEAEFQALLASINRKLDQREASIDRLLIQMGIKP